MKSQGHAQLDETVPIVLRNKFLSDRIVSLILYTLAHSQNLVFVRKELKTKTHNMCGSKAHCCTFLISRYGPFLFKNRLSRKERLLLKAKSALSERGC